MSFFILETIELNDIMLSPLKLSWLCFCGINCKWKTILSIPGELILKKARLYSLLSSGTIFSLKNLLAKLRTAPIYPNFRWTTRSCKLTSIYVNFFSLITAILEPLHIKTTPSPISHVVKELWWINKSEMFLKTLIWCQIFCTFKIWSSILTNFGSSSIEKCLLTGIRPKLSLWYCSIKSISLFSQTETLFWAE